ncbi:hypothetical protein B9Z55_024014 [Caenorhabditis nigoni]|uniref:Uncharacterized protein n=1 Tax=Caenorhabditis nigoni TaxID=1611254 RepID=A0A2G5SSE8_9PELO|nr:hypothetical protein B9Z55_024014 [Caenorhabditis nigoni]
MKQTIKDLSNALESIRKDQKWIPMLEEQLENAVYFRRINMSDCRDVNADKKENEMKASKFSTVTGNLTAELQAPENRQTTRKGQNDPKPSSWPVLYIIFFNFPEQIFKLTEALRLSEEENQALKQDVKDSRHEKGIIMNLCMRQSE